MKTKVGNYEIVPGYSIWSPDTVDHYMIVAGNSKVVARCPSKTMASKIAHLLTEDKRG